MHRTSERTLGVFFSLLQTPAMLFYMLLSFHLQQSVVTHVTSGSICCCNHWLQPTCVLLSLSRMQNVDPTALAYALITSFQCHVLACKDHQP